jgi:gamma-glutamylcyclotransferase (GGCT)/AIG2-like uncharacterized protein YtfP
MKREYLKIGISLLLLLGIAIPLSLYREKKIAKLELDDQKDKFVNFELKDIQKIKIINKLGEVELLRRKKDAAGKHQDEFVVRDFEFKKKPQWIVAKPYRAIGDDMVIESMYDQIKEVRYQKIIQETKELKKDYGLEPATLTVQFYKENTDQPALSLEIGDENNAATSFYYAASDKPGIYLGERALQPFREQDLQEWREKKIIGFENIADMEKIFVQHAENKDLSFESTKEKNDWKIGVVADNLAGDAKAINQFLMQMDGMRSSQILDDVSVLKNLKQLGEVRFHVKNLKTPVLYRVYSGPKGAGINYVQRSDLESVFMIPDDSKVLPTFQEVVSKKLLTKNFSEMVSIKIKQANQTTEIVREKDDWLIKKPVHDAANIRRLESVIQAVSDVEPLLYLKNKTPSSKDEKLKIEIGLNNQSINVVTFYQQGKEYYAKIEDENKTRVVSLYKIPSEIYEHLDRLRNTDLLPVSKDLVKRVIFVRGDSKVEIEKGGKRQGWYLNSLQNVSAAVNLKWKDDVIPEEFFDRISEMYLTDFVINPDASKTYETATLEIYTANGQYIWKFGEQKGELMDVYSPDRKVAGSLPISKYKDLSSMLDEPSKK